MTTDLPVEPLRAARRTHLGLAGRGVLGLLLIVATWTIFVALFDLAAPPPMSWGPALLGGLTVLALIAAVFLIVAGLLLALYDTIRIHRQTRGQPR